MNQIHGAKDLQFDGIRAAGGRQAHQLDRLHRRAVVIDADLRNDEGGKARANAARFDLEIIHIAILRHLSAPSRSTASAQYRSRRWSISTVSPVAVSIPRRSVPKNACGSSGVV